MHTPIAGCQMLTSIYVDGFKSLTDFSMEIRPGLNVLVGPNGSGKTSIIEFFEFLSSLVARPVADSVASSGGAGYIFEKTGEERYKESIQIIVRGVISDFRNEITGKFSDENIFYEYSCVVSISMERDTIYFKKQKLDVSKKPRNRNDVQSLIFSTESKVDSAFRIRHKFEIDLDKVDSRFLPFKKGSGYRRFSKIEPGMRRFVSGRADQNSVLSMFGLVSEIAQVRHDFINSNSLNIDPSKVNGAEDISVPPVVEKNGSGVASVLYYAKQAAQSGNDRKVSVSTITRSYRYRVRISSKTFSKIEKALKIANNNIKSINVVRSPFDNQMKIQCNVHHGQSFSVLPLSAMSDGTVKWLALITAIYSGPRIFAIEEPENYLHPLMQKQIIEIMRDEFDRTSRFSLITSHSETIINAISPSELVVVSMKSGKTKTSRPKNSEELVDIINETGFGLGFFYLAEAVEI